MTTISVAMGRRPRVLGPGIALLGALTLNVMISKGFDILVAVSLVILAMFAFGVVGALIDPPEE